MKRSLMLYKALHTLGATDMLDQSAPERTSSAPDVGPQEGPEEEWWEECTRAHHLGPVEEWSLEKIVAPHENLRKRWDRRF